MKKAKAIILGCLSPIVIIAISADWLLRHAADRAVSVEATGLLSDYTRASRKYYEKTGKWPTTQYELSKFVAIKGCFTADPNICKKFALIDHSDAFKAGQWYSPSGIYQISWQPGVITRFTALPVGDYATRGFGATACFSAVTLKTKVIYATTRGQNIPADQIAQC